MNAERAMKIIETDHLKNWSNMNQSRVAFPALVKSLIRSSISDYNKLRFPDGGAVQLSGFDGVLFSNDEDHDYVPNGFSVWELGVGEGPGAKAESDFNKRAQDTEIEQSDTVYVFITPRRWKDKEKWIEEKNNLNIFKQVRAYDAVDLQEWLAECPAVSLEFAKDINLLPKGLSLLEEGWHNFCHRSSPQVTESLVTAGRESAQADLTSRLKEGAQPIHIKCDSPQEAVGFVIATLNQIEDEETRLSFLSKALIVQDTDSAEELSRVNPLIIIAQSNGIFSNSSVSANSLSQKGHHVIVPLGSDAIQPRNPIELKRPSVEDFSKALEGMGVNRSKAKAQSKFYSRSVTIFQALNGDTVTLPDWADTEDKIGKFLPIILAGRWNASCESDREVMCSLCQVDDYDEIEEMLYPLLQVNQSPITKVGDVWSLEAPVYSFISFGSKITKKQFTLFKNAVIKVFDEIDPQVKKDPDERFVSSYSDEKLQHSEWIRKGLAETLLLLSQVGNSLDHIQCEGGDAQVFANNISKNIPHIKSWDWLASIRDVYSIMMEATPGPLLEALEALLEGNSDGFAHLTKEGQSYFGMNTMHTGILWALEKIAYDPEYTMRASLALGALAENDPGGKLCNRPINSLRDIFLSWHPCTNAPLSQRLDIFDVVIDKFPNIRWSLINGLLPEKTRSCSNNSEPEWREAGKDQKEPLLNKTVWQSQDHFMKAGLKYVGKDPEKWDELLWAYARTNEEIKIEIQDRLNEIVSSDISSADKYKLWAVVRSFIYRHLSFPDSNWSLKESEMKPLEDILKKLKPTDLIDKHIWLFDDYFPDVPNANKAEFEESQNIIKQVRYEALEEILNVGGKEKIIELARKSAFPGMVAQFLIEHIKKLEEGLDITNLAIKDMPETKEFVSILSANLYNKFGTAWESVVVEELYSSDKMKEELKSLLVILWPDTKDVWQFIDTLGDKVSKDYWGNIRIFKLEGNKDEKNIQIEKLLSVGRIDKVFDAVSFYDEDISDKTVLSVANKMMDKLRELDGDENIKHFIPSRIKEFIESLHKRENITFDEVAPLEYFFLPLLGYLHGVNLKFFDALSHNPALFVDLMCDAFVSSEDSNEPEGNEDELEQKRSRAKVAYRILDDWKTIPGLDEAGNIDKHFLLNWIKSARTALTEKGREDIGDQYIGHILAHSPADYTDEAWPHQKVRDVIEELASENVESGIRVQLFNNRGVHTRGMFAGGEQERELAEKYREWASKCLKWPRTQQLLAGIASEWDADAQREDERAEQDKIKYS